MDVRVTSRKLIKPSSPTPNHLRNFKLSCIDQLAPAAYGSFIFYYPANGNITVSGINERLRRLEKSLSEILTRFYPLAGRYMEDNNSIDCKDEGAEYLVAQVNGQFPEYLDRKTEAELNCFLPFANEVVAFSPTVLVIQVNVFDCGGLAIGVCLSHKVADGFVIFSFIQGWATACRVGSEEVASPSFDMGSILPAREIDDKFKIPVPEDDGVKMVTKRFVFNGDKISALKSKAMAQISAEKRNPSRVEVVTALIWKARIAVAEAKKVQLRPSLLTLAYNFRGKTALKIPENSFGNAFKLVLARFKPTESKLDFDDLVALIGNAITKTATDCLKIEDADELFMSSIRSMREIHESLNKNEADICVFTSVCRFPYYEIDFGWGKPSWVSSVHKISDIVLMMDTKCGRGIEAWVTLEENDMLIFQQDEDIVAFTSDSHQPYT